MANPNWRVRLRDYPLQGAKGTRVIALTPSPLLKKVGFLHPACRRDS